MYPRQEGLSGIVSETTSCTLVMPGSPASPSAPLLLPLLPRLKILNMTSFLLLLPLPLPLPLPSLELRDQIEERRRSVLGGEPPATLFSQRHESEYHDCM